MPSTATAEAGPERLAQATELRRRTLAWGRAGETVGLVPTMGALHAGHLALVRAARRQCARVVVSIFVNPLQFGEGEDYRRYPRDLSGDLARLGAEGVDACYCPAPEAMYPEGFATRVAVSGMARLGEVAARPGHFEGVATVVTKLFAATGPCRAYFGEKDAQQVALVQRLARDLDLGVEVVVLPVVRDPDGLALSSRNRLLSAAGRRSALCLWRALAAAREAFASGARSAPRLARVAAAVVQQEPGAELDYAAVVDAADLSRAQRAEPGSRLLLAARVEGVRLIDTGLLRPEPGGQG